jgi:hypothetical protein
MSREHYGLQEDQLFAAHGLLSDDVDFMRTMARDDGIAVRETGAGVGKLASLGFIEVRRSNGHDAIAKLTEAALRALVLRLARR